MKFFYRHSRGVTEVWVGRGLPYERVKDAVVIVEEGLRRPLLDVPTLVLKGGEETKSLEVLTKIYQFLAGVGADRSTTVMAVGGGALLDVATFAAGTYMRGVRLVHVPTTLLAMVDAALGGKGAVDWGDVKNLVGVFYQPTAIFCDLEWLDSLPDRVYRSAFAEVAKYGISLDEDFFRWLQLNVDGALKRDHSVVEELVVTSLKIKAGVVEVDEFEERGVRQVLNVGHTVGHAVERALGLLHGEAVSIGMAAELKMSHKFGLLRGGDLEEALDLLKRFGLPVSIDVDEGVLEKAAALVKYDKKRRGDYVYMPLVVRIGKWILEKVKVDEAVKAVRYVLRRG